MLNFLSVTVEREMSMEHLHQASYQKEVGSNGGGEQLVCLDINLFDEDMVIIKKYRIFGNNPVNCVNLENVHFLTVDFLTYSQLKQEYTENELATFVPDMSKYMGICLRFYNGCALKVPHKLKRTVYARVSKRSPFTVYKYDCLKYNLLNSFSIHMMNMTNESENDWYGDSTDVETSSTSSSSDSEYESCQDMSFSDSTSDDDGDDEEKDIVVEDLDD